MVEKEAAEFAEKQRAEQDPVDPNNAADTDEAMELNAPETVGSEANPADTRDTPVEQTTNHETSLSTEAPPEPNLTSDVGKDTSDDNDEVVLEAEEDTVIY